MFTASPGYTMVGSDFSQQEPRLLAFYSQDENMIGAYRQGRDLYSTIASGVYHNNYEDNLEHNPDGSLNPEGKARRSSVKGLLLGIMYGMQVPAIANRLGCSTEEAQGILNQFYQSYPKVKGWIGGSQEFARKYGYAEDIWGRRRRLDDVMLPKYTVTSKSKSDYSFNPLLGSELKVTDENKPLINKYIKLLDECKSFKQKDKIKEDAKKDGIEIIDNGAFIARAERQCANARIQGGAATMSKRAMIKVFNDDELNNLGFRLLIAVHDELIGECPIENAEQVKSRLSYIMIHSAEPDCDMPMKCDAEEFSSWYYDEMTAEIKKKYEKLKEKYDDNNELMKFLYEDECELLPEQIDAMIA